MLDAHKTSGARAPFGVRVIFLAGTMLVLSGVVYAIRLAVEGGPWPGDTSLRKPLLFGLSTGVTLWSTGWVVAALPRRRIDDVLYASFALALVVEVVLIDLQQWRGVASHFNHRTPFDAAVSTAMTILIGAATVVLIDVTRRAFVDLRLAADDRLAARAGLALLLVGCALGGVISAIGESNQVAGRTPEVYGEAGVLKFSHGLPLHGIQVLFLQVRALRWLGVPAGERQRSLRASIAGLAALTAYGVVQTAAGAPRVPPSGLWPWLLASASVGAFAAAAVVGARGRRPRNGAPIRL